MRGRSTLTTRLTYSNALSHAVDRGLCVDCAYFDFSKAFDSARHDYLILHVKLFEIGISIRYRFYIGISISILDRNLF